MCVYIYIYAWSVYGGMRPTIWFSRTFETGHWNLNGADPELTGSAGSSSYTAPAPRQESCWLELGWSLNPRSSRYQSIPRRHGDQRTARKTIAQRLQRTCDLISQLDVHDWVPLLGESCTVGWFVSWSCWQDIRGPWVCLSLFDCCFCWFTSSIT